MYFSRVSKFTLVGVAIRVGLGSALVAGSIIHVLAVIFGFTLLIYCDLGITAEGREESTIV